MQGGLRVYVEPQKGVWKDLGATFQEVFGCSPWKNLSDEPKSINLRFMRVYRIYRIPFLWRREIFLGIFHQIHQISFTSFPNPSLATRSFGMNRLWPQTRLHRGWEFLKSHGMTFHRLGALTAWKELVSSSFSTTTNHQKLSKPLFVFDDFIAVECLRTPLVQGWNLKLSPLSLENKKNPHSFIFRWLRHPQIYSCSIVKSGFHHVFGRFFKLRNALRNLTFDLTRDTTMASLTRHVEGDVAWRHVLECQKFYQRNGGVWS